VFVIANPASPKLYKALQLITQLTAKLDIPTPTILTTTLDAPGTTQAQQALDQGADLVLVAGGDGTLRLVAGVLAGTDTNLGVVPIGSGNIFARNLLPRTLTPTRTPSLLRHITTALSGSIAQIDMGTVTCWRSDTAVAPPEPMLTMVGIGHDAQAVAAVSRRLKNVLGWAAYVPAAAKQALAKPFTFNVASDDEPATEITAWSILAANCPLVPLRIVAFPGAVMDDHLLDRLDVNVDRAWQWGAVAAKGLVNYAASPTVLRYRKVTNLTVATAEALPVQIDGDIITDVTRMRVSVVPGALRVRVDQSATTGTEPADE
jgi:diacylglycerol kinase family enzyme